MKPRFLYRILPLILACLLVSSPGYAGEVAGKITYLKDKAWVQLGLAKNPLKLDSVVYAGDQIHTGKKSVLQMRFLDEGPNPAGSEYFAVTNVGVRPTFDDERRLVAEAHLLDFSGDIYGRRVELSFAHHLRDERRFAGVDGLREQIARDVEEGRRRLEAL